MHRKVVPILGFRYIKGYGIWKSVIWVSERAKKGQGSAICATRLFSPIFSFLLEVHALIAATILFASDLHTALPPKTTALAI